MNTMSFNVSMQMFSYKYLGTDGVVKFSGRRKTAAGIAGQEEGRGGRGASS